VSCEELSTTNIAFGGPNQSTLFITESDSGTILAAEIGIAGRVLYSHM
jgi:gluconolactonase